MKSVRKGFTLIELLVVIAIIGLLSTLAVVALNSARQRSRDAKRVSDIRQIQTALELAFSETNGYPNESAITLGDANNDVLCVTASGLLFADAQGTCSGTVFMGLVPSNPSPNGAAYAYSTATGTGGYTITFSLEGNTGQLQSGANCANANGIQQGSSC